MKNSLNHIASNVMKADSQERKNKLIEMLVSEIDRSYNKDDKNRLTHQIYEFLHGRHLTSEYCDCFIKSICGEPKWDLSETNSTASKLGIKFENEPYTAEEFRVAMHLCYHLFNRPLKENGNTVEAPGWGRMANALLDSPEIGSLVDMYFKSCSTEI